MIISIRYSIIREQYPETSEKKILDYQIQQHKLFKALGRLFSLMFLSQYSKKILEQYEKIQKERKDFILEYDYNIIFLFQSFSSYTIIESIEEARRSCGGHGFMMLSGLPSLYTDSLFDITNKEVNNSFILRSAKFFVNMFEFPNNNQTEANFLKCPKSLNSLSNFHSGCFENIAKNKIEKLVQKKNFLCSEGRQTEDVWNKDLEVESISACQAVYDALVYNYMNEEIQSIKDTNILKVLENIRQIFATCELEKYEGELVRCGLRENDFDKLKSAQLEGFKNIRKNALGLIECFNFFDESLNSVIANTNGAIYQYMIRSSKYLNPLNKEPVFSVFKKSSRPKL